MARRLFFRLLSAAQPASDRVADSDLLRRFALNRDSAAFELILRRHADAVWTACRRILPSDADAEDAFQAAFLVLIQKAGSIRNSCVGAWLHRVAANASLKLKASGRREPGAAGARAGRTPEEHVEQAELSSSIQVELARLSERYRIP